MIGKEFKIPKKNIEDVSSLSKNINTHAAGMNHHAGLLNLHTESMWATIKELLPDVDFNSYTFSLNSEKGIIRCIGLKSKRNE